jgi:hypothetical protein
MTFFNQDPEISIPPLPPTALTCRSIGSTDHSARFMSQFMCPIVPLVLCIAYLYLVYLHLSPFFYLFPLCLSCFSLSILPLFVFTFCSCFYLYVFLHRILDITFILQFSSFFALCFHLSLGPLTLNSCLLLM